MNSNASSSLTKTEFQYGENDETVATTITSNADLDPSIYQVDDEYVLVEHDDDDGQEEPEADYYFNSHSHSGIYQDMFLNVYGSKTYQDVIYNNSFLFKDKIVLDVGAGTGIRSLYCAKAGAKHVYAVECTQLADVAEEILKANGFSDVITVLKGKVEELELPVPKVDIIISEWMGYFLLHKNMLDTVLYARDKWLVNDGIVLPDSVSLHVTAIGGFGEKIGMWKDVYGFDMSCLTKLSIVEPHVDMVDHDRIVTNCQLLKTIDISKMRSKLDASFTAPFTLVAERNARIDALVAYFDVTFTACHMMTTFSTGPSEEDPNFTHWRPTVMYLEEVLAICEGEFITGSMIVAQNKKNTRDVDITLSYSLDGKNRVVSKTQKYKMRSY